MRCGAAAPLQRLRSFDVTAIIGLKYGYKTAVLCQRPPHNPHLHRDVSTLQDPLIRSQRFYPHLPTGCEGQNRDTANSKG